MLFQKKKFRCPQCNIPWEDYSKQCVCGYKLKAMGCPECMNVVTYTGIDTILKYLHKNGPITYPGCKCSCNYVFLDIDIEDYKLLEEKCGPIRNDIPFKYSTFLRNYKLSPLRKYMYKNYFDHNKIDESNGRVKYIFAYLNPTSEESRQYFMEEYGETYEELLAKTQDENALDELHQISEQARLDREAEQAAYTPKCPICGSTHLTKISALTKAAKVSALGILGAGDLGKTYKCNNCGARF